MITSRRILVIALALTVGACAYESSGVTTTTIADPNAVPPDTGPADLVFEEQLTEGSGVIVASVSLPSDGFVVLHTDEAGSPGDIIGVSELLSAGVIGNVSVPLFVAVNGDTVVHVMVHIDMDRDGSFTFEPPDGFVDVPATFANGETAIVTALIGLLPPLTPADVVFEAQRTVGIEVVVASALLPADGFLIVRNDVDGVPGEIAGVAGPLAAGSHEGVPISLDDRLEISATLWVQVAVDRDGDRMLVLDEQGGEDLIGIRVDGLEAADSAPVTAVPRAPAVIVATDQESDGAVLLLDSITLPSAGFVVARTDVDGEPGTVLAVGALLDRGTHREVSLSLGPPVEIPAGLWIELHIDLSGDGRFDDADVIARFEGGDPARTLLALLEPVDEP